jgi:hypothetical protein
MPRMRCRLFTWHAAAVACIDWYTPCSTVDTSLGAVPSTSAASSMRAAGTSVTDDVRSGVQRSTVRSSTENPCVCRSMYSRSTQPFLTTRCSSPFISATLVPSRGDRWTDALSADAVVRGSTTTMRGGLGPASRSNMRIHMTVCCDAGLWPTMNSASVVSMSLRLPGWPSAPKLSRNAADAVAVHSRVLPSMCGVPSPALPRSESV